MEVGGRVLRKRRRPSRDKDGPNNNSASWTNAAAAEDGGLSFFLEAAESWRRVVVVSGSGLSASAGMSTFSTPGGLYERAARRARLADGKSLFCWSFFERRRPECLAFLADVHAEAAAAGPTRGHAALARLSRAGALSRHFTLNIDGLAERAGMRTWRLEEDPEFNGEKEEEREEEGKEEGKEREESGEGKEEEEEEEEEARRRRRSSPPPLLPLLPPLDPRRGVTVELHGNVHELVCPDCHRVSPMTETALEALRAMVDLPCVGCPGGAVSSDDDDGENENDGDGDGAGARKKESAAAPSAPSSSSPSAAATGGPLRLRVMLYDDAQGDAITPDEVLDLLEADVREADAVLWVGLSFEQSATTGYFRRVRAALRAVGRRPRPCVQVIVNPNADDAAFNLLSSCHNRDDIDVLEVRRSSDEALEALARVLCRGAGGEEEKEEGAEEEEEEEGAKKEGAAAADVAADASTGVCGTAPPPPPPPPNALPAAQTRLLLDARDAPLPPARACLPLPSPLGLEVARARAAIAAARRSAAAAAAEGGSSSPAAAAAAAAFRSIAVSAAAVKEQVASSAPAAAPPVVIVAPVAAAFDSAPPLSGEGDEGAAGKEEEGGRGGGKALAPAAAAAVGAAAVGAAATTALPATRISLTCTSEPGDDDDSGSDDEKGGDGGQFFGSDGEH